MNARIARRLRKAVYGEDLSPRGRQYKVHKKDGYLDAGPARAVYQRAKRAYHEARDAMRARMDANPHHLRHALVSRHLGMKR